MVQEMILKAGIDDNVFKSHSKRAASTSKAFSKGANINDTLKMGNWSTNLYGRNITIKKRSRKIPGYTARMSFKQG